MSGLVQSARSAQRTPRGHGCDERTWEVGQAHITWEAVEQRQVAPVGGDGGGKGPGQGQSAATKQVPDPEPATAV
jgi:hypothetical protein